MPDYSKAVIYTIETGDDLYVGSTCNFTQRKYQHNKSVNFEHWHCTSKLYNTIRENGEWNMMPIKEFPCENKTQLLIEEEKWRKELGATLNSHWCYITDAEILQKRREYREQNKEHIREHKRQYNEKNKDKIFEYGKQYREQNKEHIREKKNAKIECPICGSMTTRNHMPRHQRSKKCKAIALQLEQN